METMMFEKLHRKQCFLEYISDGDNEVDAKAFYKQYFDCYREGWNGDAWFTPIALLEGLHDENCYISCISDWRWKTPKEAKLELISKVSVKICEEENKKLGTDYKSLANFGFLPLGLNPWRGAYKKDNNRLRLGDFPDLFFECVKCYLENISPVGKGKCGYSDIERDKLIEYKWWFLEIGCTEMESGKWSDSAWNNFVEKMQLKNSFVDENLQVITLFDHDIGNPFPTIKGVDINKKYKTDELVNIISKDPGVKSCVKKVYSIWENRADYFSRL
jgi:hypothetical protein